MLWSILIWLKQYLYLLWTVQKLAIYRIRRTDSMKVGDPWWQLENLHHKEIYIQFASWIAYNNCTMTITGYTGTLPRTTSTATEGTSIWSSTNLYTSTSCIQHQSDTPPVIWIQCSHNMRQPMQSCDLAVGWITWLISNCVSNLTYQHDIGTIGNMIV